MPENGEESSNDTRWPNAIPYVLKLGNFMETSWKHSVSLQASSTVYLTILVGPFCLAVSIFFCLLFSLLHLQSTPTGFPSSPSCRFPGPTTLVASLFNQCSTLPPTPEPWSPDAFLDDPEVAAQRPEMDAACNLWEGRWIYEPESYPLWTTGSCPWVETGFECEALGRHDTDYMKFRWQPHGCNLPRFNASDIRRRLKGRRLVFVGDSLCRNQFESALCLLGIDLPNVSAVIERTGNNLTRKVDTMVYDFTDFGFTVEYHLSHFLVGFHRAPADAPPHIGAVVNTDTVDPLFARRLFDENPEGLILVLNAGHWFTPSKISHQNVSFLVNNQTRPDIDETEGFRLSMLRVADWIQQWPAKAANATAVFRTYAPAHFTGGSWDHSGGCSETHPTLPFDPTTPSDLWQDPSVLFAQISRDAMTQPEQIRKPIINDITNMSYSRSDAHIARYWTGATGSDCSHWCLPGVPDTWNEMLFASLTANNIL
ncbi:hypothetical protein CLOM_g2171 [Closterium sp. NIES-68]|nr:hypothetical protein CLOM_g2171 [Closterium sp. NIES-68]